MKINIRKIGKALSVVEIEAGDTKIDLGTFDKKEMRELINTLLQASLDLNDIITE